MNINWSTVFFQIINFLIIIWILKKYLFKPVISSMDNREKAIQNRLLEAKKAKENADKERKNLEYEIRSLEKEKSDIMAEVYKKADAEYATLLKTFNAEMAGKRKAFEEQMTMEREFLRNSIRELAGNTIVKTVADALSDLADTDIQNAILLNFINKANQGKIKKSEALKKYYEGGEEISVRTTFELSDKSKKEIISALSQMIDNKISKINFIIDKEIVCGIEITCPPLLISYGMNTYVDELKQNLDDGLAELTKTTKYSDDKK